MHGVMLWKYGDEDDDYNGCGIPWEKVDGDSSRYDILPGHVSSLYTWQDSRCTPEFLSELPKPNSYLRTYSGYGCSTLFWLARNRLVS